MAELGSGSGSSYPGALDTDATLEVNSPSAGKTKARADVPNDLAAAIIALQTELGTDPAGTLTNVKTYLQTEHETTGAHKSNFVVTVSGAQTITGSKRIDAGLGINMAAPATGNLAVSGSMTAGTVPLARIDGFTGSVVHDFGSIGAGTSVTKTLTVLGAVFGDLVLLGMSTDTNNGLVYRAVVSTTDTISIRASNITTGTIVDTSRTYFIKVIKKDF